MSHRRLFASGGKEEMIQNAIWDFIYKEHRLMQQDNVFHVFIDPNDSTTVIIKGDNANKIPLIVDLIDSIPVSYLFFDNGVIVLNRVSNTPILSVLTSGESKSSKIWFDETAVSKSYRAFPDNVFEYRNKLFFWFLDSIKQKNEDIIKVVYNYHFVDTLTPFNGNAIIDDAKEGMAYSFSNNDLRKYTKKTTD